MQSLVTLTIDAGVLAVPDAVGSDYSPHQYVEQILACGELLKKDWINVNISEQARDALVIEGHYPNTPRLREFLASHHLVEYDVPTVEKVVNRLMSISPSFEDYFQLNYISQKNVETSPDISRLNMHESLQDNLERSITMIALLGQYCSQSIALGGHVFFIRNALRQATRVRAEVQSLKHDRDDVPELTDPPLIVEGDVLVCDGVQEFFQCLDESAILVAAQDDQEFEIALKVKLFKHAKSADWERLNVPDIGSKFRKSCHSLIAPAAASMCTKILDSIVEIVNEFNLDKTHAVRTGRGGGNPPKRQGSRKLQRHKVDNSVRLHYWKGNRGTIELVSVNSHKDIP